MEATGTDRPNPDVTRASVTAPPEARWRSAFGRSVAWIVLVANVVVLGAALLGGVRDVDQSVLAADLAAGRVDSVEVVALGQEVLWDGPLLGRRTVWEPSDVGADGMHQRVLDELVATSAVPLEVRTVGFRSMASVAGLMLPAWGMFAGVLCWGLGLGRVLGAPAPHRATRWAWGWLVAFCPFVGAAAFALLGDPDGPGPRPRTATRINGLAGFVIAGVAAGLGQLGVALL